VACNVEANCTASVELYAKCSQTPVRDDPSSDGRQRLVRLERSQRAAPLQDDVTQFNRVPVEPIEFSFFERDEAIFENAKSSGK
jgi:hypothetical protein